VAVAEFIYTMYKARKAHGDKVILDDVTMSFYPGAKIGVVGPTAPASRRSSRSWPGWTSRPTARPGCPRATASASCCRSPRSTRTKTVLGNVEEGVGEIKAKLDRFNEISERWPSPTPTSTR
jgi:hypothetical protein